MDGGLEERVREHWKPHTLSHWRWVLLRVNTHLEQLDDLQEHYIRMKELNFWSDLQWDLMYLHRGRKYSVEPNKMLDIIFKELFYLWKSKPDSIN